MQKPVDEDQGKEAALLMIVSTPPRKESKPRKKKRETEEAIPSAEALSETNLKEIPPMVLTKWKTAAYRDNLSSGCLRKSKPT